MKECIRKFRQEVEKNFSVNEIRNAKRKCGKNRLVDGTYRWAALREHFLCWPLLSQLPLMRWLAIRWPTMLLPMLLNDLNYLWLPFYFQWCSFLTMRFCHLLQSHLCPMLPWNCDCWLHHRHHHCRRRRCQHLYHSNCNGTYLALSRHYYFCPYLGNVDWRISLHCAPDLLLHTLQSCRTTVIVYF